MAQIVYLNGHFVPANEAKISVFDRGFAFADSVYEVLPVYNGVPYFIDRHIARLENSLKEVKIAVPSMHWEEMFQTLIAANGGGDLQLYLQVTRGNEGIRKHDIPATLSPTIVSYTLHNAYPTNDEKRKGLHASLIKDVRWSRCNIKTTALLANVLLNDEAVSKGAQTAILVKDHFITEGSASNVFIVNQKGTVKTPPKNNLCLPGVTREITLELLSTLNLPTQEEVISSDELLNATEVWITSTTKEIFPVTKVDDFTIGDGVAGKLWEEVNEQYQLLKKHTYD